jgi:hypothetical protein
MIRFGGIDLQLFPKMTDMNIDGARILEIIVFTPDLIYDLSPAQGLSGMELKSPHYFISIGVSSRGRPSRNAVKDVKSILP